jgi:prepilin-type N-terminal cleavage/methylation domain-containing protein
MSQRSFIRGLTLVEMLIATSIILVFLVSLFAVHNIYLKTSLSSNKTIKASYLAQEALEAVRFLRDYSWTNRIAALTKGAEYELSFTSGNWNLAQTDTLIDGLYDRKVVVSEVYRDANSRIVSSGGTLDPNTVEVTTSVSWRSGSATTTKSISTYLANIFEE